MRILEHTIDIPAPPTTVWQVLTETDRYHEWNPFTTGLSGRLAVGERVTVTIRPGRRSMTFRPTVLAVEDGTLVPFMRRLLDDTRAGFAAMDAALRQRAVAARADGPVEP